MLLKALPPGGIYVFASQLHTHLAGRGVRTVLVRGGKEVEIVQEDQHFSTHYQVNGFPAQRRRSLMLDWKIRPDMVPDFD